MLAKTSKNKELLLNDNSYIFDEKLNGYRCCINKFGENKLSAFGRTNSNGEKSYYTEKIPEILKCINTIIPEGTIIDGEICYFNNGIEDRGKVTSICNTKDRIKQRRIRNKYPPVFVAFDILKWRNNNIINEELIKRKNLLNLVNKRCSDLCFDNIKSSNYATDIIGKEELIQDIFNKNREGVMAKKIDSKYNINGNRNNDWIKLKKWNTSDCIITDFEYSINQFAGLMGALHISEQTDKGLIYRGKVGTGFNVEDRIGFKDLYENGELINNYIIEVTYTSLTCDNKFENPVYLGTRFDKM